MASPDVAGYVDLELFDVDAQDLTERAIQTIDAVFPEWEPRESDMALVLVEALAVEVSEAVFAVNRVPGAVVEVLLRLFGIEHDEGAAATATVTFAVQPGPARTIPAGTRLVIGEGDDGAGFTTTDDLTIPAGDTSGTVAVVADDWGTGPNGAQAGTRVEVVDSIAYVDGAVLASPVIDGRNPETDDDYLARGSASLSRLTSTLVLPEHFTAAALDDTRVQRATTVDLYNPDASPTSPVEGHVTVAVLGPGGVPLTAGQREEIRQRLEGMAVAILTVHVVDATVTTVDVAATVTRTPDVTNEEVAAAVEAAVREYLDPDTWPYAAAVYRNELVSVIDAVPGVARVVDITTPAADVPLTGIGPLVKAGTVTVTVPGVLA